MHALAPGWGLEVDQGDDWMFVRLVSLGEQQSTEPPMAETIWELAEQANKHKVAFEIDGGTMLRSWIVGQLILLKKRFEMKQGFFRLTGFPDHNYRVIEMMGLGGRFHNYRNREAAVMGWK